ncbi:AAA family ATPase [Bradyrhizobium japonicum]|uniref:AAA family ATPase n=1 Tax=Bradyrhizobium japonicum TaxID=375 RepID=UPI001BA70366|nr:AAA family ATPase [Bradyrhizobium japonicum]MBR0990011.1 AAA family ATPase [Bradyrhizobium japonicum]
MNVLAAKTKPDRQPYGEGYKFETLSEFVGSDEYRRNWLIKGVVAYGETSAWIGAPGSLKSALMADLSVSIAYDRDWHGRKNKSTVRPAVVYFALERADLVRRRIDAQIKRLGLEETSNRIIIVPSTIDLLDARNVPKVVRTVQNAEAFTGCFAGVLIFDTFAKLIAAGGGDEDKAKDQGRLFTNIERLKEDLGRPHVALVGHTGKDETRGSRGSNAFLGDVDVMVTISGSEIKTATVVKANDMPEGPLFSFKSIVHEFGLDEDGDPITVNIVSPEDVTTPAAKPSEPKLSANQQTFFRLLYDAGADGLTLEEWNNRAKAIGIGTNRKATLHDLRKALEDRSMVREYGGRWKVDHG